MSGGFIIDNPNRELIRFLSLYHRLKLEVNNPGGPTWRLPPAKMCRQTLIDYGQPDPGRTKKKVYDAFGAWLLENKVIEAHVSSAELERQRRLEQHVG